MQILSFEPDPKNLECLRRTKAAWRLDSHLIIPAAVSDQVGRAPFHLDEISGATGTLEDSRSSFNTLQYGVEPRVIEVETVTIDSLIAEGRQQPSIIKIDVEQAELRVLRGGEKLLREFPPILLIETFGERVATFGLLRDCGYELFDSDKRVFAVKDSVNLLALPARVDRDVASALAKIGYPCYAIAR